MSDRYFINKHKGTLTAYSLPDFVEGLKQLYEQGGSIGESAKTYKVSNVYVTDVNVTIDAADNILDRTQLKKELDSLNSKNKVSIFAKKTYMKTLDQSQSLENMKKFLLDDVFPPPRKPFSELETVEDMVDWFKEEETSQFDEWAEGLGIKIDGRLTLDKMKKSFWEKYEAKKTIPEEEEITEEVPND